MKFLLLLTLGVMATQADLPASYTSGYAEFTTGIYKELLKTQSGNFVVCPISAQIILALVANGAGGPTATELAAGLHLPQDKEEVKKIFQQVLPHLQGNDQYTLTSANKIYLKEDFPIVPEFKSNAVDIFKSDIENIDFEKKPEAAAEMNGWIEKQTHNKIKNVITEDDLNEYTRLVLINAMYFHGNWVTKFNEKDTKKRAFRSTNEQQTQVDMMEVTQKYKFYESPELKAKFVELPYQGGEVTMTFVLPNEVGGLPNLEARLGEVLNAPKYAEEKVHLVVPKFKIESTIQFKPILQALGVGAAFEDYANFEGLSPISTKISKVIQKAFIEVEEKGTTAAAATVVFQELTRSAHSIDLTKQFIADHPFIYYLKSPAGVLFVGRYVQP